ncbi:MAG: C1 family peptidase [Candidatus Poribacteria bacterium]|jgi:bleomycin hydrolase|nr:C1 family peptidase [Candidatus Poribacteria bacterium]MDP6747805.1 C1 family peptidase [Candidatus Poribacteria bacterium]MDP6995033.1 C1 family peptidase [Candidatus Poribacteria bacterium]
MSTAITLEDIQSFKSKINQDNTVKMARNAATRNEVTELAMDWEHFRRIDHAFSDVVTGEMPVTNQRSSGRCWGFAGLNLFRIYLGRKHNLKEFQFSQSYFMFWDKLEKANYFLESILKTVDEEWNSRLLMHLLADPIQDGGQWDMWVNLINKYGVVPQSEMPESFQSSKSGRMNRMITRKLRENAKKLRDFKQRGVGNDELQTMKIEMLEVIFRLLVIHLGTPPDSFDWQVRDKDNNFHRFENLTPTSFYRDHVELDLNDYVCLINCPMSDKKYNKVYTIEFLGNVMEGLPIRYLNVESDVMKKSAIKAIKNDDPVWFGCDVGKHFHQDLGVMDIDLFDFDMFYGTEFGLNKASRLEYGDSRMTHAMLFTGVDLDLKGEPIKWRVENSWGDKAGNKGYHIMTDNWFDEYNYEIVVHKSFLPDDLIAVFETSDPISLQPWDPMGALAR